MCRKSFIYGLDVEEETITDDTHIWDNTSFNEYNQSLTIDESISRLFQNIQEWFAKDVCYWGFYDRLTAVGIHYCGQITFTETSALSVFSGFSLETTLSLLGIRGLCRIAKNGLDIEFFNPYIKHYW